MKLRNQSDGNPLSAGVALSSAESRIQRKLADNLISLYILQGLNYLVPMAVLPYLVRVLGLDMYGLLAFAQSFAQYFTILTDYGFNFSATRSIARNRDDRDTISRVFCSVLVIKVVLACIGGCILWMVTAFVQIFHHDAPFFLVAYIAVIGNVLFPVWYFQGIERMRYISIIMGCSKLAAAAALFVFVRKPQDALLAIAIQSSGTLVAGIAGLILALSRSHVELRWPHVQDMFHALREGWHLFVSTAAISLYTNTNVFLVGVLAGNLEAGYFSAADKLIRGMQGLILPASQAIFPHVNLLVVRSRELALRFTRRALQWLGSLVLLPSLGLLLFARPIAMLLFGHAAIGSVPVIRWVALLPFLSVFSHILGIQTMIPFGLDKQFSRVLIAAGVFNVVLAVPLIHLFQAQGAGAAVLFAELLVALSTYVVLERNKIHVFRCEVVA